MAATSGWSWTETWCLPVVLIGDSIAIARRSTSGPPADLIAAAMSAGVTEPNRRPVSPALTSSVTVSCSSWFLTSLACSLPWIARASRARLIDWICFSAPRVQPMARPRGTR